MIIKFKTEMLFEGKYPDSMHDCTAKRIELIDNELIFTFDQKGIDLLLPTGEPQYPYKMIKLSFKLSLLDDSYSPSVRELVQDKKLTRNSIKYYPLKDLIECLNTNKETLRFYAQYYKPGGCLIITELVNSQGVWQKGHEIDFDLLVNEIFYEFEE